MQSIGLYNARGELLEVVSVGEPVELRLKDRLGQVIFGTNAWHTEQIIERPQRHAVN